MHITIYTDGGSLNNPGQAAYGFAIYLDEKLHYKEGKAIGIATNNVAEYTGLIKALEKTIDIISSHPVKSVDVYSDSQLMVRQLKGEYKVKKSHLQALVLSVRNAEGGIGIPITYHHVLRDKNELADSLVKKALGR